jgi:hypothetical protein
VRERGESAGTVETHAAHGRRRRIAASLVVFSGCWVAGSRVATAGWHTAPATHPACWQYQQATPLAPPRMTPHRSLQGGKMTRGRERRGSPEKGGAHACAHSQQAGGEKVGSRQASGGLRL